MHYTKTYLFVIMTPMILFLACGQISHRGQLAFLEEWKQPHYKEAARIPFKSWKLVDANRMKTPLGVQANSLLFFQVLTWDDNAWFVALSQDHISCDTQRAWILKMPENIWVLLNTELSYDLCTGSGGSPKYSDLTESSANFYWVTDSSHPIIEFLTNGPACTSHYLYLWDANNRTYRYYGKKCE